MKVVTLVPYRAADAARVRAWDTCRPHYEAWGYPIWTGDNPGEFARSAAINDAAAQGNWDVAVIGDADTIQEFAPVRKAIKLLGTFGAVVPWRTRWKLSAAASDRVATEGVGFVTECDLDPDDGFAHPERLRDYAPMRTGSTIVVSRAAWDAVGGFDEGFTGWGFEDQAFRWAVNRSGGITSIPGTIWHLWHPLAARDERTAANRKLFLARYRSGR